MKAIITSFEKVEREGKLPYYIARATASQGDANVPVFNEDGSLNVLALQSRSFDLTKCFFPGTLEQCDALEKGIKPNETTVNLGLFRIDMKTRFNIVSSKTGELISDVVTVEKVSDGTAKVAGRLIPKGVKYTDSEVVPRVFTDVSLTLFVDDKGESVEGNPEEIARRNFTNGIQNGTYIPVSVAD